jgi:hypothetical protein
VRGHDVRLWVGPKQKNKKGAIFIYWHATSADATSIPTAEFETNGILGDAVAEITAEGGVVAAFTTSTGTGALTTNFVWYADDFELADVIVACAVKQLNIDTRRIYTGGCSAGGLQAGAMVHYRSSYIAAAMPVSGGTLLGRKVVVFGFPAAPFEDPAHIPAVITSHGSRTGDMVFVAFADTSADLDNAVAAEGAAAVDCDWGGLHCQPPPEVLAAQWQFLKAHPFGYDPDPYAEGLPASFPRTCTQIDAP